MEDERQPARATRIDSIHQYRADDGDSKDATDVDEESFRVIHKAPSK